MDNSIDMKLSKIVDIRKAKQRQIHSSPHPNTCGMCSKELLKEKYYIDGALKRSGVWTNMCPSCFFEHGEGIGWGEGQLYMQVKKGSWLMVAGFPPTETEEDAVCIFCGEQFSKSDLIKIENNEWACQPCIEEGASIIRQVTNQRKDEKE